MKKQHAFTLSEVLVTLGIIGVISALTVPTLVKNYQAEAQSVQLRKNIVELESAIDMFITEEGKTSLASTSASTTDGFNNFIRSHFKVTKECDSLHTNECFANEEYFSTSGDLADEFSCNGTSFVLANSAAICVNRVSWYKATAQVDNKQENIQYFITDLTFEVFMDTNGAEKPNIGGRDMFHFYIGRDGIVYNEPPTFQRDVPCGNMVCYNPNKVTDVDFGHCEDSPFGDLCFGVLSNNNWKMDY